ncbi:unnamed protein product [Clonostachys solani]|uniref:Secreted protein n=1 Tax=Clonostachys solani TaxID=160281 RepID=A0A9N9ZHF3_9HYPO|nr:unnamed protein product [Clonostachys solani]
MSILYFLVCFCFPLHGGASDDRGLLSSTGSAYIFVFKRKLASAAVQANGSWIGRRLQTSLQRTADRSE